MTDVDYGKAASSILNNEKMSNYLLDIRNYTLCGYRKQPYSDGVNFKLIAHYVPQINCLFWGGGTNGRFIPSEQQAIMLDCEQLLSEIRKLSSDIFIFPLVTPEGLPIAGPISFNPEYIAITEKSCFNFIWYCIPPYYSITTYQTNPDRYMQAVAHYGLPSLVDGYFKSVVYFPKKGKDTCEIVCKISKRNIDVLEYHSDVVEVYNRQIPFLFRAERAATAAGVVRMWQSVYESRCSEVTVKHSLGLCLAQRILSTRRITNALKMAANTWEGTKYYRSLPVWAKLLSELPILKCNRSFMTVACRILSKELNN